MRRHRWLVAAFLLTRACFGQPTGTIVTSAGTGSPGFSGDNGLAANAQLNAPAAVAVDPAGNVYIADQFNNRVRRISTSGTITTYAGSGPAGFSGDGFAAVSAWLNAPLGVTLDSSGNLYIADTANCRIRKVTPAGIISTYAGNGACTSSGDGGFAINAGFVSPVRVNADQSGLYISDQGASRIRKVDSAGFISTVAGNGTPGFSGDGGLAVNAMLNNPSATAVDAAGNLYIADQFNQRIRKVTPAGIIGTYAGNGTPGFSGDGGTAAAASLDFPGSLAIAPGGTLFFTDGANNRLRKITPDGTITTVAGNGNPAYSGDGGPATAAALSNPYGVAVAPNGDVYVADYSNQRVRRIVGAALQTGGNGNNLRFVPVTPCRIVDTRNAAGTLGGPAIPAGGSRDFPIPFSGCGIPANAAAYSLNVTAVPRGTLNYLTVWPTGQALPLVSTLNSLDGRIKANAALVPAGTNGSVSVYATDITDVILDINGYFVPAAGPADNLAFYPLTPCRIADTRNPTGTFGGPALGAGQTRTFPVTAANCGIPATAQAYSLNFTAVPAGPLLYLSTWPAGQPQPLVSTLNDPTGTVVANAAIVPAGPGGAINVYVTNSTNLVIDVNGYFAPPGSAGALSFYPATPCRILDTRNPAGPFGGPSLLAGQSRSIPIAASACNVPASAAAYALNATVVPKTALAFLTLWPAGQILPLASTLNALDGSITSNAAIVPSGGGSINSYVTDPADLILDINGYFAP